MWLADCIYFIFETLMQYIFLITNEKKTSTHFLFVSKCTKKEKHFGEFHTTLGANYYEFYEYTGMLYFSSFFLHSFRGISITPTNLDYFYFIYSIIFFSRIIILYWILNKLNISSTWQLITLVSSIINIKQSIRPEKQKYFVFGRHWWITAELIGCNLTEFSRHFSEEIKCLIFLIKFHLKFYWILILKLVTIYEFGIIFHCLTFFVKQSYDDNK